MAGLEKVACGEVTTELHRAGLCAGRHKCMYAVRNHVHDGLQERNLGMGCCRGCQLTKKAMGMAR